VKKVIFIFLCGTMLAFLLVAGCKIRIEVPPGGHVATESGNYECLSGQVCFIDVNDIDFDETFVAIPDQDYRFVEWKKRKRGLCGGNDQPCWLSTTGFLGHDVLMSILDTDQMFYLTPVFVECDDADKGCDGIEITGEPEIVFDWSREACEEHDIPDLPPRAFRDRDGQVHLIAGQLRSIGPDLNNQIHLCDGVIPSHADPDPARFNDDEMAAAFYTEDGEIIYALVHNEYHGWEHPGQCTSNEAFDCWYNAVTLAISSDGGASFQHPLTPPRHLVASYPETYVIDSGPSGAFSPTSIVKGADDAYYAIIRVTSSADEYMWSCLMRSDNLVDPDSWRFWDGGGFEGRFVNPYTDSFEKGEDHVCASVNSGNIGMNPSSLTYNEYLGQYMLLGDSSEGDTEGFYYSLSVDLVNWTPQRIVFEGPPPGSELNPSQTGYLYTSFLDPESDSRSFDTVGKTAYIYYTRFNDTTGGSGDRDLMRIPIEFFRY
jgi:hypothetical protein